jgi:RNA polymerase sigma-70 factor (ECF subfamily)
MTLSPMPTDISPNDAVLVRRLRARDGRAFETLVREHAPRMVAVAGRFLHCAEDRDDAVQDALISAFRSIDAFDGKSRLGTWLHRITVNACLMKLRSRARKPEMSIDHLLPRFDSTGHRVSCDPAWSDGYERLAAQDVQRLVRAYIDQLPESYRLVLLLRDIEELDTAETARHLNCTEGNVKTRLHRARQALRTLLAPHFAGEGGECNT